MEKFLTTYQTDPLLKLNGDTRFTYLGSGAYGSVYKFTETTENILLAIKLYRRPLNSIVCNYIMEQLYRLKSHSIPHLPQIYGKILVSDSDGDSYTGLCMEFIPGFDLFDRWRLTISDEFLLPIFHQILIAISYLHSADLVHRDIKPENIRYDPDRKKAFLMDPEFITARPLVRDAKITGACGTPIYVAPEIISQIKGTDSEFEFNMLMSSDIWALGMTFHFIIYGIDRYEGDTFDELRDSIRADKRIIPTSQPPGVERLKKIIETCLQPAEKRPTARQLLHLFFN